jgi:P27 family predicted phage terminase small subunit
MPPGLKLLKGERADRRPAAALQAPIGTPECPDHLDATAREEWERIVPDLDAMGVLSRLDGSALALYCTAYSRWRKAQGEVESYGLLTETALGGLKANPAVGIAAAAEAQMQRLLVEFGCTPSSRSRVKAGGEAPKDELGDFLARKRG